MLALGVVRPINHFSGFHTFYPAFASGEGAAPFKTVADYENNLKRHKDYVAFHDRAIGRFREGMASGVFETKLTTQNVVDQLTLLLDQKVEDSPFYGPIKRFPADFSEADKARLTAAYRASIENEIYPVHRRVRDFLKTEYLPRAREGVGLVHMKGGKEVYQRLIESTTTLPLTAEEVHNTGLREVARIKSEMEAVKARTGFKGTLAEFFEYLRTDPKFKPASKEALRDGYGEIARRVDARIRRAILDHPEEPARGPAGRAVPREVRGRRLLSAGDARRLAARHLLLQHLRPALAAPLGHGDALPARRQPGPPFPDQPRPGE